MINKNNIFRMLLVFCGGAIFATVGLTLNRRILPAPILIEPPPALPTAVPTETPGPIRVFVNGAVKDSAVYEVPASSILEAVIEKAGGFTEEANRAVVNLAQPLQDGMQIYVPTLSETAVAPLITEPDSLESSPEQNAGLIDINEASLSELDLLPGIGPSTAQKIVDFREANGLFLSKEEILLVSGIGEAKYAQIEALITVGSE